MIYHSRMTRRSALALLAAGATAPMLASNVFAGNLETLAFYGPPAGPSVTLAHAVASNSFDKIAQTATFKAWRNPDELRAGLTSGTIGLSVVPVQAAANLYNRGFPIKLANIMTNGLLYVISEDTGITDISGLKGRSIAVPFKGDTPEIIFGQLLAHNGLNAASDLSITYAASPIEAMQLLLAGKVDAALTAEPSTTAGVLRGKKAGKTVVRAIDIQSAWGDMTNAAPVLPQAGLAVTGAFLDTFGGHVPEILGILKTATSQVIEDPGKAAADATKPLGMPAPLLAASVPHCNLVARPAGEARADIERMLNAMAGQNMAKIGGKLPGGDFYL